MSSELDNLYQWCGRRNLESGYDLAANIDDGTISVQMPLGALFTAIQQAEGSFLEELVITAQERDSRISEDADVIRKLAGYGFNLRKDEASFFQQVDGLPPGTSSEIPAIVAFIDYWHAQQESSVWVPSYAPKSALPEKAIKFARQNDMRTTLAEMSHLTEPNQYLLPMSGFDVARLASYTTNFQK